MKGLQFNIIAMPIIKTNDKISWGVMRGRRMVGNGDKIVQ